jgi:hypothetical protein
VVAAVTSSVDATSTPRWSIRVGSPARTLEQDQLQRRLGDGEVRVAGPALRRRRVEQAGVEGDGRVEVGDAEGELDSGHEMPPGVKNVSMLVDTRR